MMNGFTGKRAHGASEIQGTEDRVLTWEVCRAMLPLVGRIAADIITHHRHLARLRPELAQLERSRRELDWPRRARRYEAEEERSACEGGLIQVCAELERLGVVLLRGPTGLVGFPTIVNDRRAYFSWQPGEETISWWNFAGDTERHPVPDDWAQPTPPPRPRRSKPRRSR
jgi:hypothetical protein